MSRSVYSQNFLTAIAPTPAITYLVTPGDTAILTHMTLYVAGASTFDDLTVACDVELDVAGAKVWHMQSNGLGAGIYQWVGREVFTEYLSFAGGDHYLSFRANGYLLTPT